MIDGSCSLPLLTQNLPIGGEMQGKSLDVNPLSSQIARSE